MSDDAVNYFNAKRDVYTENKIQLIVSLHLDGTWSKALPKHVKNKQQQITLSHHLRILLYEDNTIKFQVTLQEFLTHIHENYNHFYVFFLIIAHI